MLAWITANAYWITPALAIIVIVDHALAATASLQSNSTLQLILGWVADAATWLQGIMSPAPASVLPVAAVAVEPKVSSPAVVAASSPSAQ